jgi:hypothetical protein
VLSGQGDQGLAEVPKTPESSNVGRGLVERELEIWELELREVFQEKTEVFAKS